MRIGKRRLPTWRNITTDWKDFPEKNVSLILSLIINLQSSSARRFLSFGSAKISLFTTRIFENFWNLDNAHIQITNFLRTAIKAYFYGTNHQISITKSLWIVDWQNFLLDLSKRSLLLVGELNIKFFNDIVMSLHIFPKTWVL